MGKKSSVIFKASDYYSPKFWPTWFILGLLRLVSLLPYRVGLFIGRLIGRLIFLLSGQRKRIVDINLAHCFTGKNRQERDRIKAECYQNIGISLIETAYLEPCQPNLPSTWFLLVQPRPGLLVLW